MGVVKYVSSLSEAEILALNPLSDKWYDQGFYYPNDIPLKPYYYRVVEGVMEKYGGDAQQVGVGISLNGKVLAGIKIIIRESEILNIPEDYDYNTFTLSIEGTVNNSGQINIG